MSVEFFKTDCQNTVSEKRFGLYDAEDNTPVKIEITDEELWNATVLNDEGKSILITAIDNCIDLFKPNGEMDSRCDCMITHDETILFVELKNKKDSWQTEGLNQIENIVKTMTVEIPAYLNNFKKRTAIVANKRHQFPSFQKSNTEQRQYFYSKYKLRIQFEAVITIE